MNTEHTKHPCEAVEANADVMKLAEMILSDCGCSTSISDRLQRRVAGRIQLHMDSALGGQHQAEPVAWKHGSRPPSVFKTSESGRQYVADFFANALRRHDFSSYIKGHLAADFACALSDGLHAMQRAAPVMRDVLIEDLPATVIDATAEAIGEAYDCVRVWEAWGVGTMGPDDFRQVADDVGRVAEIARAAIIAWHGSAAQQSAVAVAVPDGYALVPIKPTDSMLDAAVSAGDEPGSDYYTIYAAMLAAAPKAATEDSSVVGGAGAAPAEWPTAQDVGRIGDMSKVASLRVGLDADNDVYVSIANEEGMADVEFCVPGSGGGKSPRTRAALISLMVAMEADNAETTSHDWRAARNAAAQKGGA